MTTMASSTTRPCGERDAERVSELMEKPKIVSGLKAKVPISETGLVSGDERWRASPAGRRR